MSCGGPDGFIVEKMETIEKHPELPDELLRLTMKNEDLAVFNLKV